MRPDLERHFFFGMLIQIGVATSLQFLAQATPWLHPWLREHPVFVGWLAAASAGIAKELVWDLALGRGTPDPSDAAATVFGGTVAGLSLVVWTW